MGYDEGLAARIRQHLEESHGLQEKKMFGGLAFLLHGNMACGILGEDLIVRVGKEHYEESLQRPHTRVFDITGKAMRGWISVGPEGCDEELGAWLQKGVDYARTLAAK